MRDLYDIFTEMGDGGGFYPNLYNEDMDISFDKALEIVDEQERIREDEADSK